jgi:hypothetical protein
MSLSNIITLLGIALLLFYSIINILNFYGISISAYGIYLLFYIFLIVSMVVLPNEYPKIL